MTSLIPAILFALVIVLILLVGMTMLSLTAKGMYESNSTALMKLFAFKRPYIFDVKDLVWDGSKAVNLEDYMSGQFCSDIKRCIRESVTNGGKPCEVTNGQYYYSSPTDLKYNNLFTGNGMSLISDYCRDEDVTEEVDGNIMKVCKFKNSTLTLVSHVTESSPQDQNNPFSPYLPYIHGCTFFDDFRTTSPSDPLQTIRNKIYPYKYPQADHFWLVGGNIRIYLTDGNVKNDVDKTCELNLYICNNDLIGYSTNDVTIDVLKIFQQNKEAIQREIKGGVFLNQGTPVLVSYPHPFSYALNGGSVNNYEILAAIDRGMWEWNKQYIDNEGIISSVVEAVPSDFRSQYSGISYIYFNYKPWLFQEYPVWYPYCYLDSLPNTPPSHPTFYYNSALGGSSSFTNVTFRVLLFKENLTVNVNGVNSNVIQITPVVTACGGSS